MKVVVDASPLIALARIERLELLREMFGGVVVPSAGSIAEALHRKGGFWLSADLRRLIAG